MTYLVPQMLRPYRYIRAAYAIHPWDWHAACPLTQYTPFAPLSGNPMPIPAHQMGAFISSVGICDRLLEE
ncbi:MAG: hypothetical protein AB4352_21665 [Hormoscilla sp.]